MKEINDEIKLTLNLMQSDIDDGAQGELQSHLYSLLEIKRNELQRRLVERSWAEPVTHDKAPYKSVKLDGHVPPSWIEPLSAEELKAGWWWCADVSEECLLALASKGVSEAVIFRSYLQMEGLKRIHRIGNDFYWSEK